MGEIGSLDTSRMASPPSPLFSPSSPRQAATSSPSLPIMALRDRIVAKILENRVTLIVGDTGCGKSSQVPQFLLEENLYPILCTQPRRFAVVAIARMVAEARNCEVGEEVGYHIGHSNVSSTSTKIVFKTAGVLLDQMRDKGLSALKYKVIILDEVHERSVESDLVLACIKQFMMRNKDLRVVLMSATADISRYRDYFRDLRHNERVEVLAIPNTSKQTIFQRKVLYLEQIAELIGINPDLLSEKYCSGSGSAFGDAAMNPEVHTLIHKLILHIHENEPHIEKSILVFLPTYYSLEQQWILLKPHMSLFKVHILHRSIDTEQALSAMRVWKSHRKVILATNIAESSVTIPGVAFVIDSCRSLQVFWDRKRKKDATELVWVSKSQAEQRKGRTGRTCDGQIYRLVTGTLYNNLNDHEFPAILRLSLKQQVLMICCAESKAINDPKVLLQKVMDPPPCDVIEDALNVLVHIQALEKIHSHRGRYEVTFYGRLLDSLPLSFDAAVLLLKFGEVGLLHEGIIIASLMDVQPLPILQPFGQPDLFSQYLDSYFEDDRGIGKKEIIFIGNLCAFRFWERVFRDKHRLDHLKQIVKVHVPRTQSSPIYQLEDEWCYLHNLVPTALHNISEIYEDVLSVIHRFRPKFLHVANGRPLYYEPDEFKHTCFLQVEADEVDANSDHPESSMEEKCLALPYVGLKDFQSTFVAEKLSELIKEMRVQNSGNPSYDMRGSTDNVDGISPVLCKFFSDGSCYNGDQCRFSHSLQFQARRPQCKFFFTLQGCRFGDQCFFSHDVDSHFSSCTTSRVFLPEDEDACPDIFLDHLPTSVDGRVIIFNDKDSQFTSNLSEKYNPEKIIVASNKTQLSGSDTSSVGITELFGISQPWYTILESKETSAIPWENVQCVLWLAGFEENETEVHQCHLRKFFESLAIRILADTLSNIQVIITMNNVKFSHLQVERLARESFFFLGNSFPFDAATFGCLSGAFDRRRPMEASLPISYVFSMHPPTDELFGDYSSQLRWGLYNNI